MVSGVAIRILHTEMCRNGKYNIFLLQKEVNILCYRIFACQICRNLDLEFYLTKKLLRVISSFENYYSMPHNHLNSLMAAIIEQCRSRVMHFANSIVLYAYV